MGNLNIFEGSDVVHTEGENFHLNVWIKMDFYKKVKESKSLPGQEGAKQIYLLDQRPCKGTCNCE